MHITTNSAGNSAKHKNHTVPRCLLKRWLTNTSNGLGHWVLDCESGAIKRHLGATAKFAIREFRYVPVRTEENDTPFRDESLEDWFSTGENDLAVVTDKCIAEDLSSVKPAVFGGFIQACILLGYRSWYEYAISENVLRIQRPDIETELAERLVVDGFRKVYSQKLHQFKNWDYCLMSGLSEPLLLCDRPLFDMTISKGKEECLFIPLAPDLLLFGTPPSDRSRNAYTVRPGKGSTKLAQLSNAMTIERAREFVVGTEQQLLSIQDKFTAEEMEKRKLTDRAVQFVRVAL